MINDVFFVPQAQQEIDRRLENWSLWVRPGYSTGICPMFRMARSNARQWHVPEIGPTVDTKDAVTVERAIAKLPTKNAAVLRWYYVFRSGERKARQVFGETKDGLCKLVIDSRTMLKNTLV